MLCKFICKGLFIATVVLVALFVYNQKPQYSGTVELSREGYNNITITRDPFGIPTIQSERYEDVAFGLGYAHAQDRLWSIQFKRRVSQGRISEIAGEETIRSDILFRELKLDRSAKKKYQNASPKIKKILQAYADGINDYVKNLPALPLEFQIMFDDFEPYEPHHTYSLINLMAFFLTLDMVYEPFRQLLLEKYGEELALKLMGSRDEFNFEMTYIMNDDDLKKTGIFENRTENATPKDTSFQISQEYLKMIIQDDIVNMLDGVSKGIKGSNSWVVHGNHTASGKPLLANDPHLETMIPSIWYQAELIWKTEDGKSHHALGATLPGIPFLMIGRTDYLAWGITNDIIDNSDYYVEQIKNSTYFFNNEWHPLKEFPESIKVRMGKTFNFTVQETHHGPIIKGLFHLMDVKNYQQMDQPVSLSWTGHIENDSCMEGLYDLLHSGSVEQIEDSFHKVTSPTLNLIYATTDNHIGYFAQGKLPIKPIPGSNHFHNGTDPRNDWLGYYSPEEQPRIVDPAKGFIVTANNKIASDNLVHNINKAQNSIPRARRITDILTEGIKAGKKFTPKDFTDMQKDVLDVYASYVTKPVMQIFVLRGQKYLEPAKYKQYMEILENLYSWDYRMTKESIGATIYITWEHYFFRSYLHEVSDSEDLRIVLNMSYMFDHFFMFEINNMKDTLVKNQPYKKSYCEVKDVNPEGDCIKNVILAFDSAFNYLNEKYGEDINKWQWGLVHRHRFDHKPFSQTPLKYFFEREYVGEGNRRTINVGGVNHLPDKWDSWYSANYRQVVDLSENNDSYFCLDTGISENIFSPHYDDQMKLHQVGQHIPMKFKHEKGSKYTPKDTLHITFKQNNKSKSDL